VNTKLEYSPEKVSKKLDIGGNIFNFYTKLIEY